jgi:hypothetical protein
LLIGGILALIVAAVSTAAFIGVRCYGSPAVNSARAAAPAPKSIADYARPEVFTYLTLPEWFIVYSTDEYARFVRTGSASDFPYLGSVGQYWGYYDAMCQATRETYPFESSYHVMLGVIGASFTIENAIKAVYENTVGRFTEWLSTRDTPEDRFGAKVAADYGAFMHTTPWYEFDFGGRLWQLWTDVPLGGPHMVRKWERRLALSAEYGTKAVYGWLLGAASQGAYGAEDAKIHARVARDSGAMRTGLELVEAPGERDQVVRLPRYEAFTKAALALVGTGTRFVDIAGNDDILVTALAPDSVNEGALKVATVVTSRPVLTEPGRKRLALRAPVAQLHRAVEELRNAGATIEHLYDY